MDERWGPADPALSSKNGSAATVRPILRWGPTYSTPKRPPSAKPAWTTPGAPLSRAPAMGPASGRSLLFPSGQSQAPSLSQNTSAGDNGKARPPFERAWALGREAGDDGLSVDAAHMVAIAAMGTDDELPWGEKALELALASSDPKARSWRGSLLNNIGWTFHDRGDFPRALALFDEQIAVRRADAKEPALRIARWTRARCLRSLGKHELALSELRTLVDEYGAEATGDGFVHEEIAENLLALGRADEARPAFAEAHTRLASSWVNDEEPERVARLKQLGTAPDR